eukprot:CAMPEP_0204588294 /NCGR_PEP_ID=MMETSP0661-20131031/48543_1 /ASSEMBLY_ACC=CAM_ASM_000606 /TAXON_ID=109239 /ORGANISM="Alexandrium margalefi, Strain AMGDE01CS-322" /LENGTH=66 /DNA_ID=CAMNT_0051598099 /DNA_START=100 /DNA_END=296 /DNA_ORIENTATION=+
MHARMQRARKDAITMPEPKQSPEASAFADPSGITDRTVQRMPLVAPVDSRHTFRPCEMHLRTHALA